MLSIYEAHEEHPVKCQLYYPVYEGEGNTKKTRKDKTMTRIEVSKSFRMCNTNTHFEMRFEGKADTKKALEAMQEVIDPNKYDDPYMLAFSPLFLQDLGDNRTDSGFVFDSSLGSGEYDKYIPAMIKAVAKALPDASFKA